MATRLYLDGSGNYRASVGGTKDAVLPPGLCALVPNADASRVTITATNAALRVIDGDYAIAELFTLLLLSLQIIRNLYQKY